MIDLQFDIIFEQKSDTYTCFATVGLQPICMCKVNVSDPQTGTQVETSTLDAPRI